MNKAEEIHYKAVIAADSQEPPKDYVISAHSDHFNGFVEGYVEGYHQAEKGLALTWEDINRIEIIIKDVYRDYPHGIEVRQFGVEVLNRFNKLKGK